MVHLVQQKTVKIDEISGYMEGADLSTAMGQELHSSYQSADQKRAGGRGRPFRTISSPALKVAS